MGDHRFGAGVLLVVGCAVACGSSLSGAGTADGGSSGGSSSSGSTSTSSSGGGDGGASADSGSSGGGGLDGGGASSGGDSAGDAGVLPSGRSFPDTWSSIAVLTDQLPSGLAAAQQHFAANHFVGTEKQLLSDTQALRAINPAFLVLHYHLAMWQSAADFIVDGTSWSNDLPTVTQNESWFWHNTSNGRVIAPDGKFLMNVSVQGFADYWVQSLEQQVAAGQYDGIMFDSASPSLLQAWCGGSANNQDPRLAGTAAKDTSFVELGNTTWIDAWQTWMAALNAALAGKGIPLIPNDSAFVTGWDNTQYGITSGVFSEGFADPTFAESDWKASTNELLALSGADRLLILQNYLSSASDVATRLYYLGNYLLVKGHHTYLDYFAAGPLEWYPEWSIDLGAPSGAQATDVSAMLSGGVYRRDFAKGSVLVNPSSSAVTVSITGNQVVPQGGGAIDAAGDTPGTVMMSGVTSVAVPATGAAIVLH
jgi:hypothetical protein